jgi:hypothetical protein
MAGRAVLGLTGRGTESGSASRSSSMPVTSTTVMVLMHSIWAARDEIKGTG